MPDFGSKATKNLIGEKPTAWALFLSAILALGCQCSLVLRWGRWGYPLDFS